jgi:two-component system NtrC family sensor kinase
MTRAMQQAEGSEHLAARRGRLLLVDDEENILRSLRRVLRAGEWDVETASNGPQALEKFDAFSPDVVISDFRMPGMNGVELLTEVKARAPRTQRILLTGNADHLALEEAINRSEIFRFVAKPWNDAQLVLTVKSAFEQHHVHAENERLLRLTQAQNSELRVLNVELEARVQQRTLMLSHAKRDWELSFDAIDTPMAVIEGGLTIRRANRAAVALGRHSFAALGDRPRCHQFLFGRDTRCDGCPLHDDLTEPRSSELKIGDRTWVAQAFPMGDEPVAVCIYRDVTDERELTRRLVESEKMIAIGTLAGGVAHEINNPLGGILAFSQLMKREPGRSTADLESLGLIEESALRCKRIVESLLKFSRQPRAGDRRELDLARCVDDALVLFRAQARKHPKVKLEVSLTPGLLVYADAAQLGQVVLNLLHNALQALPDYVGTISVTADAEDGHCGFTVKDDGCGIPEANLSRIFEPHFTTKPPGEGTGLGLSIAYRIVEDHGGHFTVESTPGQGSRFTVTIPRHRVTEVTSTP